MCRRLTRGSATLTLLFAVCAIASSAQILTISVHDVTFRADDHFRFSVESSGKPLFAAHREARLLLDDSPIVGLEDAHCSQSHCTAQVISAANQKAQIAVGVASDGVIIRVHPEQTGTSVVFRTAGAAPTFGYWRITPSFIAHSIQMSRASPTTIFSLVKSPVSSVTF
jgi:hypothetical protein